MQTPFTIVYSFLTSPYRHHTLKVWKVNPCCSQFIKIHRIAI